MNYPRFNHKELGTAGKMDFRLLKKNIADSISFDAKQNQLKLSRKDVELLAWNAATCAMVVTGNVPYKAEPIEAD